MGMYDTVGTRGVQIKSIPGGNHLNQYILGDAINLPDGVHIGHEGWFVVKAMTVVSTGENVYDKYGNELNRSYILSPNNPINNIIEVVKKEMEDTTCHE